MGDDDDIYGSALSAGRLLKLKGIPLKREAELLICMSMIRRTEINRSCCWKDILYDNNDINDNITISNLSQLCKSCELSLSDETLGALCVRVGPVSKKYKWDDIEGSMIKTYSLETMLSKKSLIQLLIDKEQVLDIVSIQIGRSSYLLSAIDNQTVTPLMMKEVLKNIGIPGFSVSYAMLLVFSANLCDKKPADAACSFGSLITYCTERSTNMVGEDIEGDDGSSLKVSTNPEDIHLVTQMQLLLYPTLNNVIKNNAEEIQSRHMLSVLLQKIETNELGQVFKYSLRKKVGSMFLNIDEKILTLIVEMWSSTPWVYPEDIEAFVAPNGYSLSIRMPLGSFRTNRVIRPSHSTDFLYRVMEKRLFSQLKKHRTSDFNLRVPNDIRIYTDAKRTKFIPKSSRKAVIEFVEGNSRIYVWSDYVMDILDLEKSQKIELDKLDKQTPDEAVKKEEIKVVKKVPPTTADAALERLLSLGVPVVLPPRPPFAGIDYEAHKWSIPMVLSYLEDEIELTLYKETFQRHEITGYKFVCLDQNQLLKEMDIQQNMHAFKMAAYATRLREKVFEYAALNKPKHVYNWHPEHLAGWLHYSVGHPTAAFSFFKARMTLSEIRASDMSSVFSNVSIFGVEEEEFTLAAEAIKKLIDDQKLEDKRLEEKKLELEKMSDNLKDNLKNNKKKDNVKDKKETAMKRRKRQEDSPNIERIDDSTDPDEDNHDENKDINANKVEEVTPNIERTEDSTDHPLDEKVSMSETKVTKKKSKGKKSKPKAETSVEIIAADDPIDDVDDSIPLNIEQPETETEPVDDISKKNKKKRKTKSKKSSDNDADMNELVLEVSSSFRQQILMLEKVVSDQSKSVEELRAFAEKLRKEKEEADEKARLLAEEKEKAVKLIENLENARDKDGRIIQALEVDRMKASDMISIMTTKYLKEVESEKKVLTDQIIQLANANVTNVEKTNSELKEDASKPTDDVLYDFFNKNKKPDKPPVYAVDISAESPISFASLTLAKFIQNKDNGIDLLKPIHLDNLIDDNYDRELELWEILLEKYQFSENRVTSAHDTRALVARVSSLWLRLGHRMISDAHSNDTDKDEAKALLALEKCARVLFSLEIKDHEDDDLNKLPEGVPSIPNVVSYRHIAETDEKPSIKNSSSTSSLNFQPSSALLSDKCNNYVLATGMVFCLGLLRKLMDRHREEKLVFVGLVANLRKGNMPFTELSRENFRILVEQTLGIGFGKWDKFDAVCQRIDPDKKGFVNSNNILKAFQNISPVIDIAPKTSPELVESIILFTLTVCIDQLAKTDKEIDQAFLQLISVNAKKVPSFEHMIRKKTDIYYDSDDEEARNAQVMSEIQFVADILYELIRPFFDGTEDSIPSTYKSKDDYEFASSSSSLGKGKKDHMFLSFMKSNAQECCFALARGLQVYEGKGQILLGAFSTLMITFLIFRKMSLQSLLDDSKQLGAKDRYVLRKMNKTAIRHTLAHIDSKLIRLLGKARGEEVLKSLATSTAEQFEFLVSELVGLPIPFEGVLGLVTTQREVEMLMCTVESLRKSIGKDGKLSTIDKFLSQENEKKHTPAYLDMLGEVRLGFQVEKIVDKHISVKEKEVEVPSIPKLKSKEPGHANKVFDPNDSQLIREIDRTLYNQRVEHISQYLEYLNTKSSSRRKVLHNLLILWNSLKSKQKIVSKGAAYEAASKLAMKAIFKDKQDLEVNAKANQEMFPPLVISLKEIEQRALSLQKSLIEEVQKPTEPYMLTLEKKVAMLRKAIANGELVDTRNKLTLYIQEISALEQAILQCSNDCLSLSTKLIKKCNE